jgi:NAD(P)-dependent dehydrogenase (short-subunit alcohol dehydrogenase family)
MPDGTKTIALVTGANKGIGFEIASQLAQRGYQLLIGARDPGRGEAAAGSLRAQGLAADWLALDVTDESSIAAAAGTLRTRFGRLDVLVNNAGIVDAADGLPGKADLTGIRRIYDTNVFGLLAVTQAMLPLLRQSRAGRIVNLSSSLGSLALNSDPSWEYAAVKLAGYNSSKAALNMISVLLAAELKDSGITVNAVNPGYTATDLNGHRGHLTVAEGAAPAVALAVQETDGPTGGFFGPDGAEPW